MQFQALGDCTHIYSYNATWPDSLMIKMCDFLNICNFAIIVWAKKSSYTLKNVKLVKTISCKNLGGEVEKFYVFSKVDEDLSAMKHTTTS